MFYIYTQGLKILNKAYNKLLLKKKQEKKIKHKAKSIIYNSLSLKCLRNFSKL